MFEKFLPGKKICKPNTPSGSAPVVVVVVVGFENFGYVPTPVVVVVVVEIRRP